MKSKSLPLLLIIAMICPCVKMDILAPCFPELARYFNVSDGTIQFLFTIAFLGYCLGIILSGVLSDCYGRKKIIIAGNAIMLTGTLGCAFTSSINILFILHFLQGIGASTVFVLVFAIISDMYESNKAINLIGTLNATIAISMAVALVAGSLINHAVGWRGNYIFLAAASFISLLLLIIKLPETKSELSHFKLTKIIHDYRRLIIQPKFIVACVISSLLYAVYVAFFAASSFLYIKTFKLSSLNYAFQQAVIVIVFALASMSAGKILANIGRQKMIKLGMGLCIISCLLLILTCIGFPSPYLMTVFVSIFCVGFAISYPVVFSKSLDIYSNVRGVAASINMSVRAIILSTFTAMTGYFYNGRAITVVLIMSLGVVLAFILTFNFFMTDRVVQHAA